MHGSGGLHSALAITRQRRARQEKRRALERRFSSPTTSQSSLRYHPNGNMTRGPPDHKLASSIGMLHLGVVFLVLGLFLIGSGLLPDDLVTWRGGGWWNELVASGLFATALGIFLISLNRALSKKEEDYLNEYVRTQLTRSRSGHRLERDTETGCLTTKNHRRHLQMRREDIERGFTPEDDILPGVHSPVTKDPPVSIEAIAANYVNGDAHLEKILEEDVSEKDVDEYKQMEFEAYTRETMSTTTTASLSPGSPSETRELLTNGRYLSMSKM